MKAECGDDPMECIQPLDWSRRGDVAMLRACSARFVTCKLSWQFFSLLVKTRSTHCSHHLYTTPCWPRIAQGLKRLEHSTTEMIDITQNLQKASRGTNTAVQKVKTCNCLLFSFAF